MKIMEIVWLIMGLSALAAGIHAYSNGDMKRTLIFFVMVAISFFIFTLRIRLRRMSERDDEEKPKGST